MTLAQGSGRKRRLLMLANALLLCLGLLFLAVNYGAPSRWVGIAIVGLAWFQLYSLLVISVRGGDRWRTLGLIGPSLGDLKEVSQGVDRTARQQGEEVRALVADARAKASRHEYYFHRSLERLERESARIRALQLWESREDLAWRPEQGLDVLFVSSNGAGLGHLSRLLAIAEHLPPEKSVRFLTLSRGYPIIAKAGFEVDYFPSAEVAGVGPPEWNLGFSAFFVRKLREMRPRVVVFDGTWVYEGLRDGCNVAGSHLVWVQRGCWREGATSVQRDNAGDWVDTVLVPGDYADEDESHADVKGIEIASLAPIVYTSPARVLSREDACAALGLDANKRHVLLNFGGGNLNDSGNALNAAAHYVSELGDDWNPVALKSPLSREVNSSPSLRATLVEAYPVMAYRAAFEFTICAAGYNSVNEAVAHRLPAILMPNHNTRTDDQNRRASAFASKGFGFVANSVEDLKAAVKACASGTERDRIGANMRGRQQPAGAMQAARIVAERAGRSAWRDQAIILPAMGEPENYYQSNQGSIES